MGMLFGGGDLIAGIKHHCSIGVGFFLDNVSFGLQLTLQIMVCQQISCQDEFTEENKGMTRMMDFEVNVLFFTTTLRLKVYEEMLIHGLLSDVHEKEIKLCNRRITLLFY
jgi:hypothetical protein